MNKERRKQYLIEKPWWIYYYNAKARCTSIHAGNYSRYGGKGIKFLLTKEQVKTLWFRDKAYLMKSPSIDRKKSGGHYTFSNCRFIEFIENVKRAHVIKIKQITFKGNLVKTWDSIREAARSLNCNESNIVQCAKKHRPSAGGYYWRYSI